MTPEQSAERIADDACLGMGHKIMIIQAIQEAVRAAYEDAARIADEEQRHADRECAFMGKADCYNEASRYAARAAGAETIAAAIRERLKP